MELDWQNNLYEIKERGYHLLQTEKWSDCRFLVGTQPNSRYIAGHKLILAMASPVFERMFYGNLPPDKDPIEIPDVQPDAFMAMLEYIYSDRINISSFDKACELCYVAKKYMLPHVVECCTRYLWSDLGPKNACRAYEFAKLFDEPTLMQSSMEIIAANTREVLEDPNFIDIEPSTLMAILDQDKLAIDSELDLFNALLKYANERVYYNDDAGAAAVVPSTSQQQLQLQQPRHYQPQPQHKQLGGNDVLHMCPVEIKMEPDVAAMMHARDDDDDGGDDDDADIDPTAFGHTPSPAAHNCNADAEVLVIDSDASVADGEDQLQRPLIAKQANAAAAAAAAADAALQLNNIMDAQRVIIDEAMIRQAVKKIRFLTLTPQQFAEGPARSKLLQQDEALAILIKISSTSHNECPMPAGFCSSRSSRNHHEPIARDLPLFRHSVPSNRSSASENCFIFGIPTQLHVAQAQHHHPVAANLSVSESDLANTNDTRRSYCVRTVNQQFDYRNTSVTDCGLTFQVDTNIWITGVQVPTQVLCGELMNSAGFSERYTEILYAHIQDIQGSRLTYTHCTSRVRYDSLLEISFDRPIYIYRNQIYKVYVVFNKVGWYPMYTCVPDVICNRVKFMFNVGNPSESVRDGLIRAIVFSTPQDHSRPMIE